MLRTKLNIALELDNDGAVTCYGKYDIYQCVTFKCFCCRNVVKKMEIQTCYLAKTIIDCLSHLQQQANDLSKLKR